MTAHVYCWDPLLELDPKDASFQIKIASIPRTAPSYKLTAFVSNVLERYADLMQSEETVWADGPLIRNVRGSFMNISLIWSRYEEAVPFIVSTAHRHGLDCYDIQTGDFYRAIVR